jgi:hypothetical protein
MTVFLGCIVGVSVVAQTRCTSPIEHLTVKEIPDSVVSRRARPTGPGAFEGHSGKSTMSPLFGRHHPIDP